MTDRGIGHWGKMVGTGGTGVGYQTGDGVPVKVGVPVRGWGSRQGMLGFQKRDDGVPDMG